MIVNLEKLLAVQEASLEKYDQDKSSTLTHLASEYALAKQFYKAETTYWRAIEVCQHAYGEKSPELASCLEALAKLYDCQLRELEADKLREWAKIVRTQDEKSAIRPQSTEPKKQNVLNMPIAELFKQAGTVLTRPIGEPEKKVSHPALGSHFPESSTKTPPAKSKSILTMPLGDLLKQANEVLNSPIGGSHKSADKDIPATIPDQREHPNQASP